ncbi:hypothetical protein Rhopal_002424-T1 [Rhodotorula paludigena]|uniref:WD repeat-containing protein 75 second beta-propeller domain-containing protein n=1 Tax=Rhodotorula paludigena TaxID=86838 RepID=A0AAV5GL97_9BASI|nr:hypothetical protein Rhopal_002424-T1 [Rhodotorula paludigena]
MSTAALASPAARPPRQRLNKLERQVLRSTLADKAKGPADVDADRDAAAHEHALAWLPLADTAAATCPVVFTPDGSYAFIASGPAVKIYSVATTQLMSTLSIRPFASSPSTSSASLRRATVSAVLLSPSNSRQLVVGSTDGKVRLWDYLEGRLLRTLDLGSPIVHAAANANLPDQLFVALASGTAPEDQAKVGKARKGARKEQDAATGEDVPAGVYVVSLRAAKVTVDGVVVAAEPETPVQPARRLRLATPRVVRALAVSPDGSALVSLNPHAINVCRIKEINRGFTQSIPTEDESLTTVAFHPTENYFATGNSKGQIRLWYNVLDTPAVDADGDASLAVPAAPAPSTSLLHWHAHAVSSLAFTPNGAYLLSGGQEAVLVLWQLHTGHQEYVPRLGAPIVTLTVLDGTAENAEQQVAARLTDGSVVFVGSQRLRIAKTISGLKAGTTSRTAFAPACADTPIPLALDPSTSSLVLPAGHPSSLQFYSPSEDAQVLELEVSPSNRVTSANLDRPVEPTRVERVAFSRPDKAGEYWMATVDSWSSDWFAPVRQLKVWRKKADSASFVLSTRIDRPHDSPITSLTFSPSTSSPLLLTTSTDGRIKVWSFAASDASWRCRASLLHRNSAPVASAWSHDGSMFAVAHLRTVTLWSLAKTGELMHAFPATSIGRPKHVEFVDAEGTKLLVAGRSGSLCWDLLTLEETFSSSVDFATISHAPGSSTLVATEDASTSDSSALLYVLDPSSSSSASLPSTRALPFAARQALLLPSATSSTPATSLDSLSLAVSDPSGSVSLVGAAASTGGNIAPSRLPTASQGTTRLFDEIFGADDLAATSAAAKGKGKSRAVELLASSAAGATALDGSVGSVLLETPAHTLPPVRLLWRELIGRRDDRR